MSFLNTTKDKYIKCLTVIDLIVGEEISGFSQSFLTRPRRLYVAQSQKAENAILNGASQLVISPSYKAVEKKNTQTPPDGRYSELLKHKLSPSQS